MTIRILSLNTFGVPILSQGISKRLGHITDMIETENPDIICLQEVFLYPHYRKLKKELINDYPYVAYKRFLYGPKGGLVIFSKLPITNIVFTGFEERGLIKSASSFAAKLIRNGILSVELQDQPIAIFNTHLTANTDIEWSETNRFSRYLSSQLSQIKRMVQAYHDSNMRLIVAGDFNTPPDSFLYQEFIENSGLIDLFTEKSKPTYHEHFLPPGKIAKQIDYIFVSKDTTRLKMVGTDYTLEHPMYEDGEHYYVSDHIGMLADVKLHPAIATTNPHLVTINS